MRTWMVLLCAACLVVGIGCGSDTSNGDNNDGTSNGSERDAGGEDGDDGSSDKDAGDRDTGNEDTGMEDTGGDDTGGDDTGGDDAGPEDTGADDTGTDDSGMDDGGGADTGPADVGPGSDGGDDGGGDDPDGGDPGSGTSAQFCSPVCSTYDDCVTEYGGSGSDWDCNSAGQCEYIGNEPTGLCSDKNDCIAYASQWYAAGCVDDYECWEGGTCVDVLGESYCAFQASEGESCSDYDGWTGYSAQRVSDSSSVTVCAYEDVTCRDGLCQLLCDSDADCEENDCTSSGVCGCTSDSDCDSGETCLDDGTCGCADDSACGEDEACYLP